MDLGQAPFEHHLGTGEKELIMAKATLFFGIIENSGPSTRPQYEIMRVTREDQRQISGVRLGDIGGTAFNKHHLKGRFETVDAANAALAVAEHVRKRHSIPIRDADNALRRMREAMHKDIIAALQGRPLNAAD